MSLRITFSDTVNSSFLKLIFTAKSANHDCLFTTGQLFETDALIFFKISAAFSRTFFTNCRR